MTPTQNNIIKWAAAKNLLSKDNSRNQALKLGEEFGELCRALLKQETGAPASQELVDAIGDCEVVLTILKEQLGLDQYECIDVAWLEIKDRTGRTENGIFKKD